MTVLARDFTLEEMPCWRHASPADVARLRVTAERVLQRVRDRWGSVVVSSWKWWRDGCLLRTGAHAAGGTVDFITPNADLTDVFAWGLTQPWRDYIGRWIYEPAIPGHQGEHIHMAPIADMQQQFAKADSAAYVQTGIGQYTPVPGWGGHTGGPEDPIEVEGVTVTVGRALPAWLIGSLALLFLTTLLHHRVREE